MIEKSDKVTAKLIIERSHKDANLWLHTNPVKWKPMWKLNKTQFQDGLRIRYNLEPLAIPTYCPALNCGIPLSIEHSDNCKYTGLIIRRHDDIKQIMAKHAEKAFGIGRVAI